jgi:protein-tyrosine phosphatase
MDEVKNAGGEGIVVTSHITTDGSETKILDKISHQFDILNRLSLETGIDLDLYLGAEIMLRPELPQKIKGDKRLTVNGKGKYALIEMPLFEIPFYAPSIFF